MTRPPPIQRWWVVALVLLAAPLITESTRLSEQLPQYIERLQSTEPVSVLGYRVPDELRTRVGAAVGDVGGRSAGEAVGVVLAIISGDGRGVLVDFRSADQIAAALVAILSRPDLRQALEEQAYAYGRQAA